jgi:flagellar basal body-associated protein FliL
MEEQKEEAKEETKKEEPTKEKIKESEKVVEEAKVEPSPTNNKKSNKSVVVIAIVVVALIVLGIVGFGLYNGNKIASYAKKDKAIMIESNNKWSQSKLDQSNLTADEMLALVNTIKTDSNAQLNKLNGMKAPSKAKNLEAKSKEYFTIASEASTNMLAILDYAKILEATSSDLSSLGSGSASSSNDFVAMFTSIHNNLSASVTKLKAATPPASYKAFNDKYITALDRMDKAVVKIIGYVNANQMDMIATVTPEFEAAMNDLSTATPPESTQSIDAILSEAKRTKLKNYPNEIKAEADTLAKTVFSF